MRFTEENIEKYKMILTTNGNFRSDATKNTHYYHYACNECGYPFLYQNKRYPLPIQKGRRWFRMSGQKSLSPHRLPSGIGVRPESPQNN